MDERTKEILMYTLGGIIVFSMLGIIIVKMYKGLDVQLETGAFIAAFSSVVGYFFGSSKGSADKNKLIK